jgi:hypothetical protein
MSSYALRRDKHRQHNSGGARRWYKRYLHRFERRIARIAIRHYMMEGI